MNTFNDQKSQTSVTKSARLGWQARTFIDMGFNNRYLEIMTSKRFDGYLSTTATVCKKEDGCISFLLFQDYSKTLAKTKTRVTEKSVLLQHHSFDWDAVMEEAMGSYAQECYDATGRVFGDVTMVTSPIPGCTAIALGDPESAVAAMVDVLGD